MQDWYRDGIPVWVDESDRVAFDAKARVSKSRAAIDRANDSATANGKKPVPGRYFVAEPRVIDGGDMPTMAEWVEEQERKNSPTVSSKFGVNNKRNILQGKNSS